MSSAAGVAAGGAAAEASRVARVHRKLEGEGQADARDRFSKQGARLQAQCLGTGSWETVGKFADEQSCPRMRFVLSLLLFVLIVALSTIGCVTPDSPRIRDVLDSETVTFAPQDVPDALVDTLSARRVVLLGETHYVQEHQEFVLELLKRLHTSRLRWFTQEMAHAYSWIVEDYVLGLRNDYPESARRMDEYWIVGLRNFCDLVPPARGGRRT